MIGYDATVDGRNGLKKVHEWFVENRENIERNAEF